MADLSGEFFALLLDTSNLDARADRLQRSVLVTAKTSLGAVAKRGERRLEAAMASAGLGKLAKAWHSFVFPSGERLAAEPSASIYPSKGRSRQAVRAFAFGARITPRGGSVLWIPTPAARRRSRKASFGPRDWELVHGRKLHPQVAPSGAILLFDDIDRGDAEGRAARRRGGQKRMPRVLIFVGVPEANLGRRFSIDAALAGLRDELTGDYVRRLRQLPEVG